MGLPVVAIVGRPNVGKSALFNYILSKRVSIVHEQSGVTRDPVMAPCNHYGHKFLLVDTGGLGTHPKEKNVDLFDGMIRDQVVQVIADATVLIWVVNCQEGITPQDEEVADVLRKTGKLVVVAANKADNADVRAQAFGLFAPLGYLDIHAVSCTHTNGAGPLMDAVMEHLPKMEETVESDDEAGEPKRLKIAVVGRPNVGKSSLVNRLLGDNRVMVSDIPGTTRDAIDVPVDLKYNDEVLPAMLIDTAGMRRRKQVDSVVEFFSLSRSETAIKRCDIVLFMIDSTSPCTTQDRRIGRVIVDARKSCIILANKWDIAGKEMKEKEFTAMLRETMPFMNHAPLHIISAMNGYHLKGIVGHLLHVREQMGVMIPTGVFNQFLQDTFARNPPPMSGMKRFKCYYGTMKQNNPPKFVLFCNKRSLCPANYLQYLQNQIRDAFFPEAGLPIVMDLREKTSIDEADEVRKAAAGAKRAKEKGYQEEHRRIQRRKGYMKKPKS
ncbi:MAG: ribosome biogenesis GTPase Der [Lentisphaeria bacterium]|nr:ribosome biogenesis GTPase Der [Lentisphaeria bacterium]